MRKYFKKYKNIVAVILAIALTLSNLNTASAGVPGEHSLNNGYSLKTGTFEYTSSVESSTKKSTYYYSDGYFAGDGNKYNYSLSAMSMNLALAAFERCEDGQPDYANGGKNIDNLLKNIGCSNVQVNDDYKCKMTKDTIGVAIGQKTIDIKSQKYTLIPVAIRGALYESEWLSNILIGSEGEATGISQAADKTMDYIEQYLKENKIDKTHCIFWLTGYSRAGGVANISAKRLTDVYGESNVYGYCFEPATVGVKTDDEYNNIHNIINPIDAIPMVEKELVGLERYGKDHVLPSSTDYEYKVKEDRMLNQLAKVDNRLEYSRQFIYMKSDLLLYLMNNQDLYEAHTDFYDGKQLLTQEELEQRYPLESKLPELLKDLAKYGKLNRESFTEKTYGLSLEDLIISAVDGFFSLSDDQMATLKDNLLNISTNVDQGTLMNQVMNLFMWNEDGYGYAIDDETKQQFKDFLWGAFFDGEVNDGNYTSSYLTETQIEKFSVGWNRVVDLVANIVCSDFGVNPDFGDLLGSSNVSIICSAFYNMESLKMQHIPETNLSWVRSEDEYYNGDFVETNILVNSIQLDKNKAEMLVGEKTTLKAKISPSNAVNKKVTWNSSDKSVVTVSSNGEITALKPGSAIISCSANDKSGKKTTCIVTVTGSNTALLNAKASSTKKTIKVTWNKVNNADGYDIYSSLYKAKSNKLVQSVKDTSKTSYTVKGLKKAKSYKVIIKAYKMVNGTKVYIKESKVIHTITTGGKYTNASAVKTKFSKATIKIGKSKQIKASVIKKNKSKKLLNKLSILRYATTNKKVAKVSSKGKITAVGKGKCYIYVYANNGVNKKVTVSVK